MTKSFIRKVITLRRTMGRNLLYIDDSKLRHHIMTGLARNYEDLRVYTAQSGRVVLKRIERGELPPLDMIVCDYNMVTDGVEFLREIQKYLSDGGSVPEYVLLADDPAAASDELQRGGLIARIIQKPLSLNDLRALLEGVPPARKARRGSW